MGCNVKLPLNIQITNMMRNNNEEQMRRTMDAARYLWQRGCLHDEPSTAISYEEGVCTYQFGDDEVTKLFTVAYRSIAFDAGSTYVLSSLVEAPTEGAPARLFDLADRGEMDSWFKRYLNISLLPIVRTAQKQGIHFEAHLQNTLLTIRDGMPHTFIIRDLEGVSVDRDMADGADDTTGPLFYRKEAAWARTDYYFIVNHLGSLIHAIARDTEAEEEHYWAIVRDLLEQEYETSGNEYVHHLLTAEAFYAKSNLLSCLAGNSEKPTYIAVRNMMSQGVTLSSAQRS
jgi:siderophore synthetase component